MPTPVPEIPAYYDTAEARKKLLKHLASRQPLSRGRQPFGPQAPPPRTEDDAERPFRLFFYAIQRDLDAADGLVRVELKRGGPDGPDETLLVFSTDLVAFPVVAYTDERHVRVDTEPSRVARADALALHLNRTRRVEETVDPGKVPDRPPATVLIEAVQKEWVKGTP
ncbi:hypothetical protein [Anaeromyxobacter oryzae]|uniref:Uncharacterized protein n=1 Tax=Anaeromyxobacter oryzae TaxID=2918170 RepID=A0ABM7WZH4_9BACT|nr:hypothetical protein [Anaeromyxobacter oryzae]BDG04941.1 hypothetical protein AMOR_39370 [Anaeromyxobacter oryzae]